MNLRTFMQINNYFWLLLVIRWHPGKDRKKEKIKSAKNSSLSKIKLKSTEEVGEFAENIINSVREPLIALDKDLRIVKASRSFYDFFKVNPCDTIGTLIYDLGNGQWYIPKLRELLETILHEKTTFENYEVEHVFSTFQNYSDGRIFWICWRNYWRKNEEKVKV